MSERFNQYTCVINYDLCTVFIVEPFVAVTDVICVVTARSTGWRLLWLCDVNLVGVVKSFLNNESALSTGLCLVNSGVLKVRRMNFFVGFGFTYRALMPVTVSVGEPFCGNAVSESFFFISGVRMLTACAGERCISALCAGGSGYRTDIFMSKRLDRYLGLGIVTVGAYLGFLSRLGTVRRGFGDNVVVPVSGNFNVAFYDFITYRAFDSRCVADLGTGSFNVGERFIGVSLCINYNRYVVGYKLSSFCVREPFSACAGVIFNVTDLRAICRDSIGLCERMGVGELGDYYVFTNRTNLCGLLGSRGTGNVCCFVLLCSANGTYVVMSARIHMPLGVGGMTESVGEVYVNRIRAEGTGLFGIPSLLAGAVNNL